MLGGVSASLFRRGKGARVTQGIEHGQCRGRAKARPQATFQIPEAGPEQIVMFTRAIQRWIPALSVTANTQSLCQGKEP